MGNCSCVMRLRMVFFLLSGIINLFVFFIISGVFVCGSWKLESWIWMLLILVEVCGDIGLVRWCVLGWKWGLGSFRLF